MIHRSLAWLVLASSILSIFMTAGLADQIQSDQDLEKYLDSIVDKKVDIVLVFDSSGSMSGEIYEIRSISDSFADKLEELRVDYRLGLVSFRDFPIRCDKTDCGFSNDYPYMVHGDGNMTNSSAEFASWLKELNALGGGDEPESVLAAIRHSREDIRWRDNSSKAIILITDSYPHPDNDCCNAEGDILNETTDGLIREGIKAYVVGPDKQSLRNISEGTDGKLYIIRSGMTLRPILDDILGDIFFGFTIKMNTTCQDNKLGIDVWLIGKGKTIPYFPGRTEAWLTFYNSGRMDRVNLTYKESGRYSCFIDGICDPVKLNVFARIGRWKESDIKEAYCGACEGKNISIPVHYLSGRVFNDTNSNGLLDPEEEGLVNWEVRLDVAGGGGLTLSRRTDDDGYYIFEDLYGNIYNISVIRKEAWNATTEDDGGRRIDLRGSNLSNVDFGFKLSEKVENVLLGPPVVVEEWNATFSRWGWGGKYSEGGDSIQQTEDGGYIIAGLTGSKEYDTYGIWLIKTDSNGKKVWERIFDGPYYQHGHIVEQTRDGGYIIQGIRQVNRTTNASYNKILLLKTDSSGNLKWANIYGSSFVRTLGSLDQTEDDGYILTGDVASNETRRFEVLLMKVDSQGLSEWQRTYEGPGDQMGNSVLQAADGGYLIAGTTTSYGAGAYDFWLIKTDSSGNMEWNRTYGGLDNDMARIIQPCRDGGYILGGATGLDEGMSRKGDAWIIKIDSIGNKEWDRSFGESGYLENVVCLEQTNDGGYVIGVTSTRGINKLIKIDGNGNEEYEFQLDYRLSLVRQTEDGGFIVVGSIDDPVRRVQGLKMTKLKVAYGQLTTG
jgi:hypothetical protein